MSILYRSMHTKAFRNRFTWKKLRSFLHFKITARQKEKLKDLLMINAHFIFFYVTFVLYTAEDREGECRIFERGIQLKSTWKKGPDPSPPIHPHRLSNDLGIVYSNGG